MRKTRFRINPVGVARRGFQAQECLVRRPGSKENGRRRHVEDRQGSGGCEGDGWRQRHMLCAVQRPLFCLLHVPVSPSSREARGVAAMGMWAARGPGGAAAAQLPVPVQTNCWCPPVSAVCRSHLGPLHLPASALPFNRLRADPCLPHGAC